jgi:hypothetical protein
MCLYVRRSLECRKDNTRERDNEHFPASVLGGCRPSFGMRAASLYSRVILHEFTKCTLAIFYFLRDFVNSSHRSLDFGRRVYAFDRIIDRAR